MLNIIYNLKKKLYCTVYNSIIVDINCRYKCINVRRPSTYGIFIRNAVERFTIRVDRSANKLLCAIHRSDIRYHSRIRKVDSNFISVSENKAELNY